MPLSAFHNALRAFRSGRLAYDDLSTEIDRQLTVERVAATALLEILTLHQSAEPLPLDTHAALARQISEWPEDPTVVTGPRREARAGHPVDVGVGDLLHGRFSLVALAGEGGMSRVYKAIDLRRAEAGDCDPHVAVKVLKPGAAENAGSVATLMHEMHRLQRLSHPNIVRVMDCGRDGRAVFMTMEYLAGQSLRTVLRNSPNGMAQSDAIAILSAIGAALEYAHGNRIVHGDLKPGNVIVTEEGSVKVIDFGVSKFMGRADEHLSDAARPAAITPRYASPELVAHGEPEPADDVYALACIAYEALSGSHPAGHPGDSAPRIRPPRPASMPKHRYLAIVRGLAFERGQRTASVRQFLDELTSAARSDAPRRWAGFATLAIALTGALYFAHSHQTASRAAASADAAVSRDATAGRPPTGSVLRDCPVCPALTVLPAGSFNQGVGEAAMSSFERPRHPVTIRHSLAMGSNEVTVGEYRQFVAATHREAAGCVVYDGHWAFRGASGWQDPGFAQTDRHPATCVSWDDAVAYADWLGARTGRHYRLPSSSEWEYAAEAGSESTPELGAEACAAANVADRSAARRFPGWNVFPCDDAYVNTAPVGSFRANAFGLSDMLGNVFEWVEDCWHDDYTGAPGDGGARVEADCTERELRGGSWFSAPQYVSPTYRNRFDHSYRSSSTGFRVVRESGQ